MTNETNPGTVDQAVEALKHAMRRLPGVSMALGEQMDELDAALAAQSQPAATVQEVEDPTIADAVLSFAKARAWHHFGIAWDRLERVSQDELLEQTRGLINLPSPSKAVGPASELVDFWDLVTPDQREKLWVSLHGLACNPTLDEIPLVMEEVVAIMRPSLPTIKEVKDDAQNKLLETARRNIRMFINGAAFRDREAALACIDVLEAAIAPPSPQPDMGSGREPCPDLFDIKHDEAWEWITTNCMAIRRDNGDMDYSFGAMIKAYEAGKAAALSSPASQSVEKDALKAAYEAGALAVHEYWQSNPGEALRGDPEFGEAASDYAAATLPHKEEATPAPVEQGEGARECGVMFGGHGMDRHLHGMDQPCPLPSGHDGPHHAGKWAWETDLACNCDDCQTDEPANWCVIFWEREAITTLGETGA